MKTECLQVVEKMEREMGFEPTTSSLGSWQPQVPDADVGEPFDNDLLRMVWARDKGRFQLSLTTDEPKLGPLRI